MLWHGKNFRGIIKKAKEMIFDNTGTNLVSTNAEDAIKEVNSKLSNAGIVGSSTVGQTSGNITMSNLNDYNYLIFCFMPREGYVGSPVIFPTELFKTVTEVRLFIDGSVQEFSYVNDTTCAFSATLPNPTYNFLRIYGII